MQQVCHYTAVVDLRLLEAERLVDRVTELLELVFWEAYLLEPSFLLYLYLSLNLIFRVRLTITGFITCRFTITLAL